MRVRYIRAAMVAVASLSLTSLVTPAMANFGWGFATANIAPTSYSAIVTTQSISEASALAFNQSNPTVVSDTGSIPATSANTQFAFVRVNSVDGSARAVLFLRYSSGAVYAIVNSDTTLAAIGAASSNDHLVLTDDFSFGTENGQTVVRMKVWLNGTSTFVTVGRSSSIVSAFTDGYGECRNIGWGGGGTIGDGEEGVPDPTPG